jgi:hypothetical protein
MSCGSYSRDIRVGNSVNWTKKQVEDSYKVLNSNANSQPSAQFADLPLDNAYKLWGFLPKWYGLWGIEDLWVMGCKSPRTELVDQKSYGIREFMGYQRHGL